MVNKSINLLGESCPRLTLRALKELSRLKENESLVIRFNDPIAKIDLTVACERHNYKPERLDTLRFGEKGIIFEMTVSKGS